MARATQPHTLSPSQAHGIALTLYRYRQVSMPRRLGSPSRRGIDHEMCDRTFMIE